MFAETAVHKMPKGTKSSILSIWSSNASILLVVKSTNTKLDCVHMEVCRAGVLITGIVNWMSVRFILLVAKIQDLDSRVIDFVLAFPQAKLDVDVFMEIPSIGV